MAASARKECIKNGCKKQKKECFASFKGQFDLAKPVCGGNKVCQRGLKKLFRDNKKRCKKAFKPCKACCKADPQNACSLHVFGDGLCRGVASFGEQCDGTDDAFCPGQCSASCSCSGPISPGTPGNPDSPIPGESQVGHIDAGKTLIVFVDDAIGSRTPFLAGDVFLITMQFGTQGTGGTPLPAGDTIGPCQVLTEADFPSETTSPDLTPYDPGFPGSASNGASSVSLLPGGSGSFVPTRTPAQLFNDGFGANQTVTFEFPGGDDIGAFSASVPIPPDVGPTSPNFADPAFRLDFSGPLNLTWVGANPGDTLTFVLAATTFPPVDPSNPPPADFVPPATIATCNLPDTGSAAIPGEVMSRFPDGANFITLTLGRSRATETSVGLTGGGTGRLALSGATAVLWTYTNIEQVILKR